MQQDSPPPDDDELYQDISKSQRKRDADAIRELGIRLSELSHSERSGIPLPDDVVRALNELDGIKAHGARKRQTSYLAKRLRNTDIEPVEAALEKIRHKARANTLNLHRIEQWRDRLLGLHEDSEKMALTAFFETFTHADRQKFRHLQRQALTERRKQAPPAASRELFRAIRDLMDQETSDTSPMD